MEHPLDLFGGPFVLGIFLEVANEEISESVLRANGATFCGRILAAHDGAIHCLRFAARLLDACVRKFADPHPLRASVDFSVQHERLATAGAHTQAKSADFIVVVIDTLLT